MSWQGGSLYRTRKRHAVGRYTSAYIFPKGSTEPKPAKPFGDNDQAWFVVYTGITNSLYAEKYGWSAHREFRYAFRSKEHAERFLDYAFDHRENPSEQS